LNSNLATPEVFRIGLKYNATESNGFISFYRGSNSFGGYLGFSTNGVEQLRIATNGNIGIGTDTPVSKVSVAGSITLDSGLSNTSSRPLISSGTLTNGEIRAHSKTGNAYDDGFLRLSAGGGTNAAAKSYIDLSGYSVLPDMARNIVLGTYGVERMRIDMNGKIGVGTSNPDEVLTVNGKIHAKEIRIDLASPMTVPDYVFANDYKLKSLQEVEAYIKENSHLPEIPSGKEIEEKGLMLAEMNMSLLKKIEELTLYVIDQKKYTDKLNHYIIEQNKILVELNNRLMKLEKVN
jgi:hypothetical protein